METKIVLGLLGGLALFLYGMQMMSSGLEAAAGNRMKQILEKLTSNRFLGVAVGAGITAAIQSSSATTVMVVGFVNSRLMTLRQAVWLIMGANIGTTITGQLIALDVGALAPVFAFLGVALIVFLKKAVFHHYGQIIAGLGILFIGMEMMGTAMEPLRDSPVFIDLMTRFSNPVFGILIGMVFTAVIQSSSASVGILQTLAKGGLIGLPHAVYILFGQNIGTCVTAVLASVGAGRSAKQTTLIHLFFNLIGTTLFTLLCVFTPLTAFVEGLTPAAPAAQIANMHTIFNVATTLLLLPFGERLASLAEKLLPEKPEEKANAMALQFILPPERTPEHQIGNTAIAAASVRRELERMSELCALNVEESFLAVLDQHDSRLAEVTDREELIDFLNREISTYISKAMIHESNPRDSALMSAYFKISSDLERIADHALNICEYTKQLGPKKILFSDSALAEVKNMRAVSLDAMCLISRLDTGNQELLSSVSRIEQEMDDLTEQYRTNQIERMKHSLCLGEAGILYSEMLTDFERIGDHVLNIGEELAAVTNL